MVILPKGDNRYRALGGGDEAHSQADPRRVLQGCDELRLYNGQYNGRRRERRDERPPHVRRHEGRDVQPALVIGRKEFNHHTLEYQYRLCYTMPLYCTGALSRLDT